MLTEPPFRFHVIDANPHSLQLICSMITACQYPCRGYTQVQHAVPDLLTCPWSHIICDWEVLDRDWRTRTFLFIEFAHRLTILSIYPMAWLVEQTTSTHMIPCLQKPLSFVQVEAYCLRIARMDYS